MSAPTRPFPGASKPPTASNTPTQSSWSDKGTIDWNPPGPVSPLSLDNTFPMQRQRRPIHEVQKAIRSDSRIYNLENQTNQMQTYITQLQSDLANSRENEAKKSSHIKKLITIIMELASIDSKLKDGRKKTEIRSEDFHHHMEILEINEITQRLLNQHKSSWGTLNEMVSTLNEMYSLDTSPLSLKDLPSMPIIEITALEKNQILEVMKTMRPHGVDILLGKFKSQHGMICGMQLKGAKVNISRTIVKIVDILESTRNEKTKGGLKQYPPHFTVQLLVYSKYLDKIQLTTLRNTFVQRNQQIKRLENTDELRIIGSKYHIATLVCEVLGAPHPMRRPSPQPPVRQRAPSPMRQPPKSRPHSMQPPKRPRSTGAAPRSFPTPIMITGNLTRKPKSRHPNRPTIISRPKISKDAEWTDVY